MSALCCPLATPTILLGFLLPSAWGISSRLLQQGTAAAPYLGRGVTAAVPDLQRGMAPLGPPVPGQPPPLGRGIAPPGHCPGLGHGESLHGCSSKAQPLLLTLDEGYLLLATPPDLERGVAPLSPPAPTQPTTPWTWGCSSQLRILRIPLEYSVLIDTQSTLSKLN